MTHIASYVQALAFSVLFLVFINGSIGWALVYTIVGTVLLSVLTFIFSRKNFSVELKPQASLAEHSERVSCEVIVKKTGFCFLPFIELCVTGSTVVRVKTSLLFRNTASVTVGYKTCRSGMNSILVDNAVIRDFAGLVQLNVPVKADVYIGVAPDPIEYSGPEIAPKLLPADDEETEESRAALSGGLPGCEHRDYVPGDPLRRINYKLSAKRHKLMVRLDESFGYATTNLLIAQNGCSKCCDLAFALAQRLVLHGGSVKITHNGDSIAASAPETLEKMREWLAFRFYSADEDFAEGGSTEQPDEDTDVMFSGMGEITVLG